MIRAEEALRLPSAQLNAEEKTAADLLESKIEENVRSNMERRGIDLDVKELNQNVIAEVNQRLRAAGFTANWAPKMEAHPLNKAQQRHVGWSLSLFPTDEAYRAAERATLS